MILILLIILSNLFKFYLEFNPYILVSEHNKITLKNVIPSEKISHFYVLNSPIMFYYIIISIKLLKT